MNAPAKRMNVVFVGLPISIIRDASRYFVVRVSGQGGCEHGDYY